MPLPMTGEIAVTKEKTASQDDAALVLGPLIIIALIFIFVA